MEIITKTNKLGSKYYECSICSHSSDQRYMIKRHFKVHDDTIERQKRGRKSKTETLNRMCDEGKDLLQKRKELEQGTTEFKKVNHSLVMLNLEVKDIKNNQKRKDYLAGYSKEYATCPVCDRDYKRTNKTNHEKTKFHKKCL